MQNIFVISDTWFNRLLQDDQNLTVVANNDNIISTWNEHVTKDDVVYVLGGFGIGDLYHILTRLNGEIHFLDNYYSKDERSFMEDMKNAVNHCGDADFQSRIIFEDRQIMVLPEYDAILSYFPLLDWSGKFTGTYCFHGLTGEMCLMEHDISCIAKLWDYIPMNIKSVQGTIVSSEQVMSE